MPTADKIQWPQGEPLFEVNWRAMSESLAGNGIVNTGDFQVTATANAMEIQVAAGTAYYVDTEYSLGAAQTFTISAADGTYDRWDTIYFNTNANSASSPTAGVRTGTAESNPEPPDIQGDEILLAVVYVPANATDIPDSNILNWRGKVGTEAEEIHFDDPSSFYNSNNVEGALQNAIELFIDEAGDNLDGPLTLGSFSGQSPFDLTANPGAFGAIVDAVVDSNSAAGTSHSYSFALDANTFLEIYAESDGAGGIQNARVDIEFLARFGGDIQTVGGTTIWDSTNGFVPRAQIDDQRITNTVTANYTTSDEEVIFVDPSGTGGVTITLASADAADGNVIVVQDVGGTADANPITVATEGTETIDGNSTVVIDTPYAGNTIVSDGTNWTRTGAGSAAQSVDPHTLHIISGSTETIPSDQTDHIILPSDRSFDVDGQFDVDGSFVIKGA